MVCHTHILLKWWPQEIIGPSLTSHSYLVCVVRTFWKSTPLATFKYTGTVLWMILTRLYISPPRAYLSYNWKIMPFYHLHLLLHIPPVISGSHQSFLSVKVCFSDSIYINTWDHTVFLWIISLSALKFYPCCYTLQDIIFYDWILLHVYATSLFIHQWTLMLFPNLGYCK